MPTKKYRDAHPEKTKEQNDKWITKNQEPLKQYRKQYREKNKEKHKQQREATPNFKQKRNAAALRHYYRKKLGPDIVPKINRKKSPLSTIFNTPEIFDLEKIKQINNTHYNKKPPQQKTPEQKLEEHRKYQREYHKQYYLKHPRTPEQIEKNRQTGREYRARKKQAKINQQSQQ